MLGWSQIGETQTSLQVRNKTAAPVPPGPGARSQMERLTEQLGHSPRQRIFSRLMVLLQDGENSDGARGQTKRNPSSLTFISTTCPPKWEAGGGSSRHTASAGHRDTRGESEADGAVTERAPGGKGGRRVGG